MLATRASSTSSWRATGHPIKRFVPVPFDTGALDALLSWCPRFRRCSLAAVCGVEFRCDASLETCADFDLWLRLSGLEIIRTEHVLGRTRLSSQSISQDPDRYEQFCRDKITALDNHLARHPDQVRDRAVAVAGIYCWAAESLLAIEGPSPRCEAMLNRARKEAPAYERIERLAARFVEPVST